MNISPTFEQNEWSYSLIRSNLTLFSALMKGPKTLDQLVSISGKTSEQTLSTLFAMKKIGLIHQHDNRFESAHHSIHLTRDECLETLVNQYFFPVISTALVCEQHQQLSSEISVEEYFLFLEPHQINMMSSIISPFLQSMAGEQLKSESDQCVTTEYQFCCFGLFYSAKEKSIPSIKAERVISQFQQSLILKNDPHRQKQAFIKFAEMFLYPQDMKTYYQICENFSAELKKYSAPQESSNFYLSCLRVPKSLVLQTGGNI